ncbi:4Fe-4S dicluster domain-containing protein [Patescibacteria group bacterium]
MTTDNLKQFISFLLKQERKVYAPVQKDGRLLTKRIHDPKSIVLNGQLTHYPWRKYFLPAEETLFNIHGEVIKKIKAGKPQVLIGLTMLDLRALELYNQVFADDVYYQERKRETIIIGQSLAPAGQREFAEFQDKFQENILEHLEFDIFLEKTGDIYKVFTGSEDGQRILEKFGYSDYENIKYVGPILEEGIDKEMLEIKDKMENEPNQKLWTELGEKCLNCGQCTLACPTCYCFNVRDQAKVKSGEGRRVREWSACFYPDFSRIAGGYRFLNTTAKRIFYWYEHKFVRDPERYKVPGCVRCGRCTKACPVGIDIMENISRIKSGE